jgi:hypothetical protein
MLYSKQQPKQLVGATQWFPLLYLKKQNQQTVNATCTPPMLMLERAVRRLLFGRENGQQTIIEDLHISVVEPVNAHEHSIQALSAEELKAKTTEFRHRLSKGESLDAILPEVQSSFLLSNTLDYISSFTFALAYGFLELRFVG